MNVTGISLQGRIALARHDAAAREREAQRSSERPHLTLFPAVSFVRIEVAWDAGPADVKHAWYLDVPPGDVTDELLDRLELMAARRERKHLRLMK